MSTLLTFTATCPGCGETQKLAAFRVKGQRRAVCRTCTQRAVRRAKAQKQRLEARRREVRHEAAQARRKLADSTLLTAMRSRVAAESASARSRVRAYTDKIQNGRWGVRTLQALERQTARVRYYDALQAWIVHEAQEGQLKPYLHYRSNSWLLYIHGCRATYEKDDKAVYVAANLKPETGDNP